MKNIVNFSLICFCVNLILKFAWLTKLTNKIIEFSSEDTKGHQFNKSGRAKS